MQSHCYLLGLQSEPRSTDPFSMLLIAGAIDMYRTKLVDFALSLYTQANNKI